MKQLKAKISLLIGAERTRIEIIDEASSVRFLSIELSPDELSRALSRESHIPCTMEVRGLDKLGKAMEVQKFDFELPEQFKSYDSRRNHEALSDYAQSLLSDGWQAETYFGSKDSFFTKDGKDYGRVTIRRWNETI